MDSRKSLLNRTVGLVAALALNACNSGTTLSAANGHYEGFVVDSSQAVQTQMSVGADAKVTNHSLVVAIKAEPSGVVLGASELDLNFQFAAAMDSVVLSSNGSFLTKSISMRRKGDCFVSGTDQNKGSICLSGSEITLILSTPPVQFVLDKLEQKPVPQMEEPATYTVDKLVEMAKTRSFADQIAFKQLVEAKDTAKTAYMNLLPHLNINVGMNIQAGVAVDPVAFMTIARSIGDLVPFVLPNRWFQAKSLQDTAQSDVYAYKIVQATSMNIVRGLAFSVLRDEEVIRHLEEKKDGILSIRDEILALVQTGGLPIGSADQIDGALNSLDSAIATVQEDVGEEKIALAQGAGFVNPRAVTEVQAIDTSGFGPVTGDVKQWEWTAEQRSLALIQEDYLIASAQQTKDSRYYQWLDPSGDDQGSFGFGVKSYLGAGQAAVDEVVSQRSQTLQTLLGDVDNTLSQSATNYKQYKISLNDATVVRQGIVDQIMTGFRTGTSKQGDPLSLALALSSQATDIMNEIDEQYALLTLQDEINFLTFSGPYADLNENSDLTSAQK